MRLRAALSVCAAVGAAVSLSVLPGAPTARSAINNGGDFIVRCFYNGHTQPMDPIFDPGGSNADHLHIFFGNMIQGTPSFPSITSGDGGGSGPTMESNGLTPQTNCQDTADTAGYWMPAPYVNGQPYTGGGGCSATCSPSTDMHLRVYYLSPASAVAAQEIPDGSIMVAGYPNGCQKNTTVNPAIAPPGCTYDSGGNPSPSYPNDTSIVRYTCGDSAMNTIMTPVSAWPYDCANYRDGDDSSFNDGIVAIVDFPQCWNGNSDWTPPNGGAKVPGYIAPWIPDANAPTSGGVRLNDFAYETNGSCQAPFSTPVVQLEERFHPLTAKYADESVFGEPSTCFGGPNDTQKKWNTDNAELTDSDGEGPPDTDTHHCSPASGPASTSDLSFACSPHSIGGDTNCNVALKTPTGCGSPTGTCWIGAPQFGFETLHADYWQAWQEGVGDAFGDGPNGTDSAGFPSQGDFRDLVEDCTNEGVGSQTGACSFIDSSDPAPKIVGRVFSETSSNT